MNDYRHSCYDYNFDSFPTLKSNKLTDNYSQCYFFRFDIFNWTTWSVFLTLWLGEQATSEWRILSWYSISTASECIWLELFGLSVVFTGDKDGNNISLVCITNGRSEFLLSNFHRPYNAVTVSFSLFLSCCCWCWFRAGIY